MKNRLTILIKGKYTLRQKVRNDDETLDINDGSDSDIDVASEDEDDVPLAELLFVNDEEIDLPADDPVDSPYCCRSSYK